MREAGFNCEEHAFEVGVHDVVPLFFRHVYYCGGWIDAGIIAENIDFAIAIDHGFGHGVHIGFRFDVPFDEGGGAAIGIDVISCFLK